MKHLVGKKIEGSVFMRIGILRLNVGNFGKINTYNVQEIGLAREIMEYGHKVEVFYLYNDVDIVTEDILYPFVHYFPHKSFGMHGIFDVKLLEAYNLESLIVFADNQLWQNHVINWCEENRIPCICYWGAVLSTTKKLLNQFYTWVIYKKNYRSYFKSVNVTKTLKVKNELQRLKIPVREVIHVGLDRHLMEQRSMQGESIRNQLNIPTNAKVLLFVGRMVPNKNPFMAVELLCELIKEDPNYYMMIIGDGVLSEKLAVKIRELGVSGHIVWKRLVEYKEMYKYYLCCDCVINLCASEIFGMVMLEGMYYGRLVVARNAAGPSEYIQDGKTGYICYSDNIQEWKHKIHLAMNKDPAVIEQAQKLIQENYLWSNSAMRFLKLLEDYKLKLTETNL